MIAKSNFIDIINEKMTTLGIKQKALAEKMCITEDRLSRILSGKSKMLADEMIKLCILLDIDPNIFRLTAWGLRGDYYES